MAAQSLSTHIYHPSPAYHRDFFMLRMPIKIDNQPSVIKMVGTTPVLHCPEVELSVQLVVLAQHVSTVLTEYRIALKGAYYDDNYPLYAIDLPPPISYEGIQSLLPAFSSICYSIAEKYFSRVPCKTIVAVHLQLLLCSAAKDSFTASKVTSIQLGQESHEILLTFLDSKMFKFSELFAARSNLSTTIIGSSSTAAAVSFEPLLRALSEKASHKWFNLGTLLGVSAEKLQRIEKQCQNPDSCLLHTLRNVVVSTLTWEEVVSTLSTVGLSNLAEELSKEHGVCFLRAENEEPASLTKPTLQSLSQCLAEVSAKWFNFGALLGVPPSTLQAIDNQYHSDCDDCLTRMLMWLIENSHITWSSVAQALSQIGYGDLAEQIRQSHDISPVSSEGVPQQVEARADDTTQWKIEAESSVTEVQQDIDTLIQQDYPNMKDVLNTLQEEKDIIEKRLEQEQTQCNSLHESKRLLTIQLKQKDKQYCQKIEAIEKEMIEKESKVADLKSELDRTNMKYNEKSQKLADLAATLSLKTSELVEKSFVLSKIEESFFECDDALKIVDGRILDYQRRLVEAKQVSQAAYLAEIKRQMETETECVKSLEEEYQLVESQCSDLATIVASIERDIATKEQTLESDTEVFVEQQIELTKLKMDVTSSKLELAKSKVKRRKSTQELAYHQKDYQIAKNLLPKLSKCIVDGVVHKARSYVAMEITVHLHDRDGEPCSGQHLVALRCESDEEIFTEANSSTPGTYSLSYTPSCLGEHLLVVTVNSTPINETPFNMFFLNSPHPPNCTVTVLDKKIVQHKKFDVLVQLRDQNGDPVNSQQNVSAYLKFSDIHVHMASEKTKAIISSSSDSPDKYTLALTPPPSGEGVLSVFVDDQPVASPCVITISESGNMLRVFKDRAFKMLLIGETGSGKTSFLNLLYNCATVQDIGCGFGAEGLEQFKQFNDIELENAVAISMETKTSDATLYNVVVGDLKVGVIDTPGFGDSRGFDQDKTNAQRIVSALKREEYINCICLIINGRQPRASASLKYVLSEIAAILPRISLNNVIVVFSNTADPLDLTFDPDMLKGYFGKEVENIFCVENPYCQLEKAKAKVSRLGIDTVAKSLKKAFENTSEVLTEMCETIKDFPHVPTHCFVELYEKKNAIGESVIILLTLYNNQMSLEKSLKDVKARSDEQRAKTLYSEIEKSLRKNEAERKQLSLKLSKIIAEFESLGLVRSFAGLIENQLAMIETHLEGTVGSDTDDLRKTRNDMKTRLQLIRAAKA